MLKKLILAGVVAALAGVALKGTKFFGYAKHEVAELREWAEDQVPVEKKLDQMRKDVADLDRDAEKVKDALAREIVDVRELTAEVGKLRAAVETESKGLVARGQELKDATERVKFGRTTLSVPEAKEQLKRDVDLHVRRKQQLVSLEATLGHRERIRETLEKQLDGLRRQKLELTSAINAVEAEYKALQYQQIESRYQTDDTRLARVKESLRQMQKKLDVERERLKLAPVTVDSVATPTGTQSVDEILAPLAADPGIKPAN